MDCILLRGSKWWDCHVEIMGRPGLYGGMARVLHDMSVSFSFHKKTKFTFFPLINPFFKWFVSLCFSQFQLPLFG